MGWNLVRLFLVTVIVGCIGILSGCQTNRKLVTSFAPDSLNIPTPSASYIRPTEPDLCPIDSEVAVASMSPDSMIDYHSIQYTPITLSECINRALLDSEVFRDLGGAIIAQPSAIESTLDPALRYTDPTFGEDAALSAFDANMVTGAFFENNDRPFNNRFSGDSNGILVQDLGEFKFEISKLASSGTLFTSRSTVNYDHNNQAGNRFEGSAWEAIIDTGFRHPLMQGSGSLFNRIAGPSQVPGSFNGVLIARTNTEISLADFEESSREFVSNVENAYWDLYYAYRELNAQTDARNAALDVLKKTKAKAKNERISKLEEASAEEQYLRFESAIIESLEGRVVEGTQANSGTSGGSFRRTVGVRVAERRLRYLIGMPITDGTLLQPAEQPGRAPIVFDWQESVTSAISERPEARRQAWVVKQKELELTAARNFLMPRLDLVGNYRFRGLGKSLTGGGETLRDDINSGAIASNAESGAFSDLAGGDFQEVQLGAELRMPIGYRRANAGVRNAELSVQRERAVLKEQERKIILDLSNAVAEARRAHSAMLIAEKRFEAAETYRAQAAARIESGRSQMDVLLEAQRRMLEAQIQFINAEVEYAIAIKNVHFEKGTFLQYHGVVLSESESSPQAYISHDRRLARRNKSMNYIIRDASIARTSMGNAVIESSTDAGYTEFPLESQYIQEFGEALPVVSGEGIASPMMLEGQGTITEIPGSIIEVPNGGMPVPNLEMTPSGTLEFTPPAKPQVIQPGESGAIQWTAPPVSISIPANGPTPSKRVVLSDSPSLGVAPPTSQPARMVLADTAPIAPASSAVTTNLSSPAAFATQTIQTPVKLSLSDTVAKTTTKPKQAEVKKPGFTVLQPLLPASGNETAKESITDSANARISDSNSKDGAGSSRKTR